MPRNACRECRSRKIKCVADHVGGKCERCTVRNLPCSYVPEKPPKPAEPPHPNISNPQALPPQSIGTPARGSDVPPRPTYHLTHEISGLDIGTGQPSEILREGEFTQSLLLLYFSNFSDVHFMFDEELFLRQFAVGEVPKIVLYAMMALSIRYSHAPFEDRVSACHRGEILYDHTREMLKQEFDEPTTATIQVYVLLSTYKLTFGGARQANLYLGFAVNMVRALRLLEDSDVDPLRLELTRRLIGTIALMDRILSSALKFPLHMIASQDIIPVLRSDEEFVALRNRTLAQSHVSQPSVAQEVLNLSKILARVCHGCRSDDSFTLLSDEESEYRRSAVGIDPSLAWTEQNLEWHQHRDSIRRFAFMTVLYHHVGQLVYFKSLSRARDDRFNLDELASQVRKCHQHARTIVDIVDYTWNVSGFDLHNFVMGQVLTVATVVHTHALLLATTVSEATDIRNRIETIRACVIRVKRHCRMFNWVWNQLEVFLRLCDQSKRPLNELFDRDPTLLGQMLQLGSHFERLDYQTGGRLQGFEMLLRAIPGGQPFPLSRQDTSSPLPAHHIHAPPNHDATSLCGNQAVDISSPKWTMDDLAWAFWDSSLPHLYALPNG